MREQHLRPVLAFGAAGAGVDLEVGVVGVGLAREQRLDLPARHLRGEPRDLRLGIGDDPLVALRLAELDQAEIVGKLALGRPHRRDRGVEVLALAHDALRVLRVVPEIRILDAGVQLLQPAFGDIPVKDASGSAPRRRGSHRQELGSRPALSIAPNLR